MNIFNIKCYCKERFQSQCGNLEIMIWIASLTLAMTMLTSSVLASGEINKKLELKPNFTHLLTFDERIIRYRMADDTAFDVEILPDIMNSRNEMLLKPLKEINTNFLVWTENHVYNFDINVRQKEVETVFFNIESNKKKTTEEKSSTKPLTAGKYRIDSPPAPQKPLEKTESEVDFEIDLPPQLK